jgi:hypothetical protein
MSGKCGRCDLMVLFGDGSRQLWFLISKRCGGKLSVFFMMRPTLAIWGGIDPQSCAAAFLVAFCVQ